MQMAFTVNWSGGEGKNVERLVSGEPKQGYEGNDQSYGSEQINRASKAAGGVKKFVEAYEKQVSLRRKSTSHTHKSSAADEKMIMADLRSLRPFKEVDGRRFESFCDISHHPTSSFDEDAFET